MLSPVDLHGRAALTGSLKSIPQSPDVLLTWVGGRVLLLSGISYESAFRRRVMCWPGPAFAN